MIFSNVAFLAISPMMLGILEVLAHLAAIKMFNRKRFYSPGLVTAALELLPMGIYTIVYAVLHSLMQPMLWLYSFIYMLAGLLLAQQVVVRMSGMKYTDFLKNVRATLFTNQK
jgi:hypothetical protein